MQPDLIEMETISTEASCDAHQPTPALRFYLLGPLRIERDGQPLRLPRRKVEALVAYLLLHPGPQPRDSLATLFWGDSSDAQARHSLRTALATVRKEIAPDLLLADRDYVQLNPAYPCWVDLWALFTLADAIDSNRTALPAALALWQGDLLADCYEEWLIPDREHYRIRLINRFLQVIQSLRARSDYGAAITVAQQLLTVDPANEQAHQHLMFCYMASGDRHAALRQYEHCERTLRAELDVPPLPETTSLYRWIKQNRQDAQTAAAQITNLPIPLTSFVGRMRETAAIKQLLTQSVGCARLLTLTGAGGSGKTRLAIQVATDLIDHFLHGVWWIELAPLTDDGQIVRAVAKAIGVNEVDHEPCWQSVVDFVGEHVLLLVIDNCEHLVGAAAQLIGTLLRHCPNLQVLATSRERLDLAGERVWQVPTLPVPDPTMLTQPDPRLTSECIQLFVERAAAVQPDFRLTAANAPAIGAICAQLDGIPLAIELAAARVKVLPVEQIAARLQSAIGTRFTLLTQGSRTAQPRQQTLRAAIDWSYELLTEAERQLFHLVAVFRGGFTLAALEALVAAQADHSSVSPAATLDLLTQLVDKSLVMVEPQAGEHRYRLLETLREYAWAHLAASADLVAAQQAHALYYLGLAEQAVREMAGPQQQSWLNRAELEHPNLRAALASFIAHGDGEQALRLAVGIYHFWHVCGYISEGRQWFQQALAQRATATVVTQAKALGAAGWLAYGQSDFATAQALYTESLALFTATDTQVGIVTALQSLALVEMKQGDYASAQQRLAQSLARCRTMNYAFGTARGLGILGTLALDQNQPTAARLYYSESLHLHQQLGGQVDIATSYMRIGDAECALGNLGAARTNFTACLEIGQTLSYTWLIGNALRGLGMVALAQQDYVQARRYCEEALQIYRRIGDKSLIGFALATLGRVAYHLALPQAALAYYSQSLAIVHAIGYRLPTATALEEIAQLLTTYGCHQEIAIRFWGAAQQLRQAIAIPRAAADQSAAAAAIAVLQSQVGAAPFARLWQAGGATSLAQLVREANALTLA